MLLDPDCPVCANKVWRALGTRAYRLIEMASLTPYVQKRYRVLFEVWFPGETEVEITSCLCEHCGFVLYTPRPETSDLDAKYRFLGALGADPRMSTESPVEITRARELYRAVSRLAGRKAHRQRVFDFGGGDGRLMWDFLASGCACDVVDYTTRCVPGVCKVGDTLDELSETARYDWIICSHVIEHVAEPLQTLKDLQRHLAPDGVLYIEVPMEIWGKPPLQEEPVTHVNFFTQTSLRHLMERSGLGNIDTRLGAYRHPSGRQLLAVRAVGGPNSNEAVHQPPSCDETERLLHPRFAERVYRYALAPENLWGAIRYRIERSLLRNGKYRMAGHRDH